MNFPLKIWIKVGKTVVKWDPGVNVLNSHGIKIVHSPEPNNQLVVGFVPFVTKIVYNTICRLQQGWKLD